MDVGIQSGGYRSDSGAGVLHSGMPPSAWRHHDASSPREDAYGRAKVPSSDRATGSPFLPPLTVGRGGVARPLPHAVVAESIARDNDGDMPPQLHHFSLSDSRRGRGAAIYPPPWHEGDDEDGDDEHDAAELADAPQALVPEAAPSLLVSHAPEFAFPRGWSAVLPDGLGSSRALRVVAEPLTADAPGVASGLLTESDTSRFLLLARAAAAAATTAGIARGTGSAWHSTLLAALCCGGLRRRGNKARGRGTCCGDSCVGDDVEDADDVAASLDDGIDRGPQLDLSTDDLRRLTLSAVREARTAASSDGSSLLLQLPRAGFGATGSHSRRSSAAQARYPDPASLVPPLPAASLLDVSAVRFSAAVGSSAVVTTSGAELNGLDASTAYTSFAGIDASTSTAVGAGWFARGTATPAAGAHDGPPPVSSVGSAAVRSGTDRSAIAPPLRLVRPLHMDAAALLFEARSRPPPATLRVTLGAVSFRDHPLMIAEDRAAAALRAAHDAYVAAIKVDSVAVLDAQLAALLSKSASRPAAAAVDLQPGSSRPVAAVAAAYEFEADDLPSLASRAGAVLHALATRYDAVLGVAEVMQEMTAAWDAVRAARASCGFTSTAVRLLMRRKRATTAAAAGGPTSGLPVAYHALRGAASLLDFIRTRLQQQQGLATTSTDDEGGSVGNDSGSSATGRHDERPQPDDVDVEVEAELARILTAGEALLSTIELGEAEHGRGYGSGALGSDVLPPFGDDDDDGRVEGAGATARPASRARSPSSAAGAAFPLATEYVFDLLGDERVTSDEAVPVAEAQRRAAVRGVRLLVEVVVNEHVVASTRLAPLLWPVFSTPPLEPGSVSNNRAADAVGAVRASIAGFAPSGGGAAFNIETPRFPSTLALRLSDARSRWIPAALLPRSRIAEIQVALPGASALEAATSADDAALGVGDGASMDPHHAALHRRRRHIRSVPAAAVMPVAGRFPFAASTAGGASRFAAAAAPQRANERAIAMAAGASPSTMTQALLHNGPRGIAGDVDVDARWVPSGRAAADAAALAAQAPAPAAAPTPATLLGYYNSSKKGARQAAAPPPRLAAAQRRDAATAADAAALAAPPALQLEFSPLPQLPWGSAPSGAPPPVVFPTDLWASAGGVHGEDVIEFRDAVGPAVGLGLPSYATVYTHSIAMHAPAVAARRPTSVYAQLAHTAARSLLRSGRLPPPNPQIPSSAAPADASETGRRPSTAGGPLTPSGGGVQSRELVTAFTAHSPRPRTQGVAGGPADLGQPPFTGRAMTPLQQRRLAAVGNGEGAYMSPASSRGAAALVSGRRALPGAGAVTPRPAGSRGAMRTGGREGDDDGMRSSSRGPVVAAPRWWIASTTAPAAAGPLSVGPTARHPRPRRFRLHAVDIGASFASGARLGAPDERSFTSLTMGVRRRAARAAVAATAVSAPHTLRLARSATAAPIVELVLSQEAAAALAAAAQSRRSGDPAAATAIAQRRYGGSRAAALLPAATTNAAAAAKGQMTLLPAALALEPPGSLRLRLLRLRSERPALFASHAAGSAAGVSSERGANSGLLAVPLTDVEMAARFVAIAAAAPSAAVAPLIGAGSCLVGEARALSALPPHGASPVAWLLSRFVELAAQSGALQMYGALVDTSATTTAAGTAAPVLPPAARSPADGSAAAAQQAAFFAAIRAFYNVVVGSGAVVGAGGGQHLQALSRHSAGEAALERSATAESRRLAQQVAAAAVRRRRARLVHEVATPSLAKLMRCRIRSPPPRAYGDPTAAGGGARAAVDDAAVGRGRLHRVSLLASRAERQVHTYMLRITLSGARGLPMRRRETFAANAAATVTTFQRHFYADEGDLSRDWDVEQHPLVIVEAEFRGAVAVSNSARGPHPYWRAAVGPEGFAGDGSMTLELPLTIPTINGGTLTPRGLLAALGGAPEIVFNLVDEVATIGRADDRDALTSVTRRDRYFLGRATLPLASLLRRGMEGDTFRSDLTVELPAVALGYSSMPGTSQPHGFSGPAEDSVEDREGGRATPPHDEDAAAGAAAVSAAAGAPTQSPPTRCRLQVHVQVDPPLAAGAALVDGGVDDDDEDDDDEEALAAADEIEEAGEAGANLLGGGIVHRRIEASAAAVGAGDHAATPAIERLRGALHWQEDNATRRGAAIARIGTWARLQASKVLRRQRRRPSLSDDGGGDGVLDGTAPHRRRRHVIGVVLASDGTPTLLSDMLTPLKPPPFSRPSALLRDGIAEGHARTLATPRDDRTGTPRSDAEAGGDAAAAVFPPAIGAAAAGVLRFASLLPARPPVEQVAPAANVDARAGAAQWSRARASARHTVAAPAEIAAMRGAVTPLERAILLRNWLEWLANGPGRDDDDADGADDLGVEEEVQMPAQLPPLRPLLLLGSAADGAPLCWVVCLPDPRAAAATAPLQAVVVVVDDGAQEGDSVARTTSPTRALQAPVLIDPATGECFTLGDRSAPQQHRLASVDAVVTLGSAWANRQQQRSPNEVSWALGDRRHWDRFAGSNRSSGSARRPEPLHVPRMVAVTSTDGARASAVEVELGGALAAAIRASRPRYVTRMRWDLVPTLRGLLLGLERDALASGCAPPVCRGGSSADELEATHRAAIERVAPRYRAVGVALPVSSAFTARGVEGVTALTRSLGLHSVEDDTAQFAVAVAVVPYPGAVLSVWIYCCVLLPTPGPGAVGHVGFTADR